MKLRTLVLCCLVACCARAEGEPQLTMHRTQACPQDGSGWCQAASEAGRFSLALPIPFNDFTLLSKAETGEPIAMYTVGGKSSEGVKFTVTCTYNPKRPASDATVRSIVDSFKEGGTVSGVHEARSGPLKGYDLEVREAKSGALIRILQGHSAVYQIIIEYPVSEGALARNLAPRVLSSFAVAGPPRRPDGVGKKTE